MCELADMLKMTEQGASSTHTFFIHCLVCVSCKTGVFDIILYANWLVNIQRYKCPKQWEGGPIRNIVEVRVEDNVISQ